MNDDASPVHDPARRRLEAHAHVELPRIVSRLHLDRESAHRWPALGVQLARHTF